MEGGDFLFLNATNDPSREASFKTYATTCIRNAMVAEIRTMFPVRINDKQTKKSLVRNGEAEGDTEVFEQAKSKLKTQKGGACPQVWGTLYSKIQRQKQLTMVGI